MNRKTALLIAAAAAIIILSFCSSCTWMNEEEAITYAASQGYVKLPDDLKENVAYCYYKAEWHGWKDFCKENYTCPDCPSCPTHDEESCREDFPCRKCPKTSTNTGGMEPVPWDGTYPTVPPDGYIPIE